MEPNITDILPRELHQCVERVLESEKRLFAPEEIPDDERSYKGRVITPGFKYKSVKYCCNELQFRPGDILVATYPKSGTNLMVAVLRRILTTKYSELRPLFKRLRITAFLIEALDPAKFKIFEEYPMKRRLFCTHLPAELIGVQKLKAQGVKIIYITRNVKDQTVSWYHFYKQLPAFKAKYLEEFYQQSWDNFVESYTSGNHPLTMKKGEWYPEHILGWWKYRNEDNIMLMTYEEIVQNMMSSVKRVSEFIGESLTDEEVVDIVQVCSFKSMKKRQNAGVAHGVDLIRKGKVGGWKAYFTVAQSEAIEGELDKKMANHPNLMQLKARL